MIARRLLIAALTVPPPGSESRRDRGSGFGGKTMRLDKVGWLVLLLGVSAGCAERPSASITDGVAYYSGTAASSSPDGRIPYGKTEVVLK